MKSAKNQVQMGISIGNINTFRKAVPADKLKALKASLRPYRIAR